MKLRWTGGSVLLTILVAVGAAYWACPRIRALKEERGVAHIGKMPQVAVFEQVGFWRVRQEVTKREFRVWVYEDNRRFLVRIDDHLLFLSAPRLEGAEIPRSAVTESGFQIAVRMSEIDPPQFQLQRLRPNTARFTISGNSYILEPRPALLGEIDCNLILEQYPEILSRYESYAPNANVIESLASSSPTELEFFMGSWCPIARRVAGPTLKVLAEAGSLKSVRCFGIGAPVTEDPIAISAHIDSVPVLRAPVRGQPCDILPGRLRSSPERALEKLLVEHICPVDTNPD